MSTSTMQDANVEVRPAGTKGRGLFAAEPIAAGQRILALMGTVMTTDLLDEELFAMQIGPDSWLCSDGSSLDDFINHSCDANAGFSKGSLELYALRDIAAGEEIGWDYSTSISESGWQLECYCGSVVCRGIVRPWPELSDAQRGKLRSHALKYLRES